MHYHFYATGNSGVSALPRWMIIWAASNCNAGALATSSAISLVLLQLVSSMVRNGLRSLSYCNADDPNMYWQVSNFSQLNQHWQDFIIFLSLVELFCSAAINAQLAQLSYWFPILEYCCAEAVMWVIALKNCFLLKNSNTRVWTPGAFSLGWERRCVLASIPTQFPPWSLGQV